MMCVQITLTILCEATRVKRYGSDIPIALPASFAVEYDCCGFYRRYRPWQPAVFGFNYARAPITGVLRRIACITRGYAVSRFFRLFPVVPVKCRIFVNRGSGVYRKRRTVHAVFREIYAYSLLMIALQGLQPLPQPSLPLSVKRSRAFHNGDATRAFFAPLFAYCRNTSESTGSIMPGQLRTPRQS